MEFYGLKRISSSCSDLHEACPYSLEQILQKGKCSVRIIKAFSSETNETVAIKLFPKTTDGQCLQAFTNEEKALENLSHQHILNYRETFQDAVIKVEDGRFVDYSAIVMDYVEFGDLYSLIFQNAFSEKLARSIFKQMITVTSFLHNQDLMHLDLKLENFLVTPQEGIKLIDFESCQKLKKNGSIIAKGTPGYRAPEVINEDFQQDPKALDIYSLGVVLFMMVAGTPPYTETHENGKWKFDKYYDALRSDVKKFWGAHERYRVSEGKEAFSKEFKEIVEGMLSLNASKRPKVEDLKRSNWLQGEVYTDKELEKELNQYFMA